MTAILQVISCLHLLVGTTGQLNSGSVLSTSSLSRMVVSRSTGDVFLADRDTIYLLPGDLSEVTSNVSRTAGQTPEGMTLSKQEDKLIVCWASAVQSGGTTINDAPCVVYNSSDLLQTLQTVPGDTVHVGPARGNPYLVSEGFVESEGETFYVMSQSSDDRMLYHREYRIPDGAWATETNTFSGITSRRYVSGAATRNYSYFATTDREGIAYLRVIRVCNIDPNPALWDSWYDIQVICGTTSGSLADFDNELISADFLFPGDGVDEPVLVVSVLTPDLPSSPSSFCAVPLSTIDDSARNLFSYCATNDVQLQFPWANVGPCDTAVSLAACMFNCLFFAQPHACMYPPCIQLLCPNKLLLSAGTYNRV